MIRNNLILNNIFIAFMISHTWGLTINSKINSLGKLDEMTISSRTQTIQPIEE